MRITTFEKEKIVSVFQKQITARFDLYLFGSRADDLKQGGDIDLLLVLDQNTFDQIAIRKHYFLAEIKNLIGDQKVDLSIRCKDLLQEDPFYQSIKDELITLNK